MVCDTIRELLSEYIDGVLDVKSMVRVEEHLSECDACKSELISLRALVRDLHELEPVRAPDGFLEQVHARLEKRTRFRDFLRDLFAWPRIKVPIQLATAVVLAVMVFSVLFVQLKDEVLITPTPSETKGTYTEKDEVLDSATPNAEQEGFKREFAFGTSRLRESTEAKKPIELTLEVKRKRGVTAHAPGDKPRPPAAPMKETTYPAGKKMPEAISQGAPRVGGSVPLAKAKNEEAPAEQRPMTPSPGRDKGASRDEARLSTTTLDDLVYKVKRLIEEMEGKIAFTGYDRTTGRIQYIIAEIAPQNYSAFCEGLKSVADLSTPPPAITEEEGNAVQIRIRFPNVD